MLMRRIAAALLAALFLVGAAPGTAPRAWADCCVGEKQDGCCKKKAAANDTAATPDAAVWTSQPHGYRLRIPEAWRFKPRTGPDDVADVRFESAAGPRLSGSYQVFEGALTENPRTWYDAARKRYEEMPDMSPMVRSVAVGPLEDARLGGSPAHAFQFVTVLKNGGRVVTRVVFAPRRAGERVDVHELIVSGETAAVEGAREDLEGLSQNLQWTDGSTPDGTP